MNKMASFSLLEKEYIRKMRNKINNSEDKVDLQNHFSNTITNLLNKIFKDKNLTIRNDDIAFDSKKNNYYSVNQNLLKSEIFKKTWDNSDLQQIINRFADSVYHRYLHLDKHPEKTVKKIRN